jgi:hypothetical protein
MIVSRCSALRSRPTGRSVPRRICNSDANDGGTTIAPVLDGENLSIAIPLRG